MANWIFIKKNNSCRVQWKWGSFKNKRVISSCRRSFLSLNFRLNENRRSVRWTVDKHIFHYETPDIPSGGHCNIAISSVPHLSCQQEFTERLLGQIISQIFGWDMQIWFFSPSRNRVIWPQPSLKWVFYTLHWIFQGKKQKKRWKTYEGVGKGQLCSGVLLAQQCKQRIV